MIRVIKPGSIVSLIAPGTFGHQVVIDQVSINRDGGLLYTVDWWDDGLKSTTVRSSMLEDCDEDSAITTIEFDDGSGI